MLKLFFFQLGSKTESLPKVSRSPRNAHPASHLCHLSGLLVCPLYTPGTFPPSGLRHFVWLKCSSPHMTPSLLYFLQFLDHILPLWGQHWSPYLKLQPSFLNFLTLLFWCFFFFSYSTYHHGHTTQFYYFQVDNQPLLSFFYPLEVLSLALWLDTPRRLKTWQTSGGGDGLCACHRLLSLCYRLPPQGRGLPAFLFPDVISSTQNSPWYSIVVGTQ